MSAGHSEDHFFREFFFVGQTKGIPIGIPHRAVKIDQHDPQVFLAAQEWASSATAAPIAGSQRWR